MRSDDVHRQRGGEADLEEIGDYIAHDNPERADTFIEEIRARFNWISHMPRAYRRGLRLVSQPSLRGRRLASQLPSPHFPSQSLSRAAFCVPRRIALLVFGVVVLAVACHDGFANEIAGGQSRFCTCQVAAA